MKKVLIASTALVAAGMITTGAQAADKIKLDVGGFSKWWVVGQFNDDNYTARDANGSDFNSVDVKGDNEIHFKGTTKLDNGLTVGVVVEMEAGGHTDSATDMVDESYVTIGGGFGTLIVGSENNGTYLLHVMAPDAAGNWADGGIMTAGSAIQQPTAVASMLGGNTTAILTDGDADKITYVAPTFGGLTLGASYVPGSTEDNRGLVNLQTQTASEIFGAGALFAQTFGGVGVKVSAGYVHYDLENNQQANKSGMDEMAFGGQVSFAGFTLGGSYRNQDGDAALNHGGVDGTAWDAGIQYASGPYAVSFAYFHSEVDASAAGDDEITFYQVSGKYTMGPGVDVLASVGHADYQDGASSANNNNNEGWTVMTGLSLAF